ncbi:MAG TPA: S41 family peptidase [Gemmatimonadales bacterium]|nr:S41 family peptidase [Gemmatimonadales bacterium]
MGLAHPMRVVHPFARRAGLAAALAAAFALGNYLGLLAPRREAPSPSPTLVDDVLRTIRAYSVDSLSETDLTYLAAQAIVERLRDPYAALLKEERARRREVASEARATGEVRILEPGIGYVALTAFTATSAADLRRAITELHPQRLRALILDLRDNPGGLVREAVQVADLFLDPDLPIATVRGRSAATARRFVARHQQEWPDLPLVVLVNAETRSAAELVAGALQEHDRAAIVGEPTYGKGSVQQTIRLRDSIALRLTTARWYTPSGRGVERTSAPDSARPYSLGGRPLPPGGNGGVVPDLVAPRDRQLQAAVDLLRHARTTRELLELASAAGARAASIEGR